VKQFFYFLNAIIIFSSSILVADVGDSQKVSILAKYLMQDENLSSAEARSQALSSVYGKPELKDLKYDSSSEMFFGRLVSENRDLEKDINFYMPRKRALEFEKDISQGVIEIEHSFKNNRVKFEDVQLEYKGIKYPLATQNANSVSLKLGAYFLSDQNTELLLKKDGVGAILNLQDFFNLEKQTNVLRIEAAYKFSADHKMELSWYKVNNRSYQTVDKSFEYNGHIIEAGSSVDMRYDTEIYKLMYAYSAYQTNKLNLMFRAGLHVTSISTRLAASISTNLVEDSLSTDSLRITKPLPVFGFGLEYKILSDLYFNYNVDYFLLSYDNALEGALVDTLLSVEYKYNRYVGVGVGLNATKSRLHVQQESTLFETRNEVMGALAYLIFSY